MAEGGEEEGDDDSPEQARASESRLAATRATRESRLDSLFCYTPTGGILGFSPPVLSSLKI